MKRQFVLLISIILVLSAILAGCGGNGDSAKGSDGNSPAATANGNSGGGDKNVEPVTLDLWTFNELHAKFYMSMADLWNKEHPDQPIELKAETFPYDDMHNKLLVALQSGVGAPDISDIELNKFPNYLKGDPQLVPLNDVIDPIRDKLVKARLDIYSKDGQNYGLPFHVGAAVIYYNKEILGKAGVNPDDIKTWDDFEAAGKQVLAKTGVPMTTLETTDVWSLWQQVAEYQGNTDFLDANGNVAIDQEPTVKALEYEQRLMKEGVAVAAPGGFHHAEEYYGFMNQGGAASVWMPFWYMGRFTDYMPDLKGKIVLKPMPAWTAGGNRSAGMGGTGTVVTKQSKHQDLAKQFIAFAKISEEGELQIWQQLGFDPVRTDVWERPELKEDNKFTDYFGQGLFDTLVGLKSEIEGVNIGEKTPAVQDIIKTTVLVKTLVDQDNVQKVLQDAAKQLK